MLSALLKSRAAISDIRYNRLADGPGGRASYELEFPNGGQAYVIGNVIQQGAQTQNPHMVSFGAEGYKGTLNELYLINNTLVDDKPQGGVFLRVTPGNVIVKAVNNLLVGNSRLESGGWGDYLNNFTVSADAFQSAAGEDYRLKSGTRLKGKAVDPGSANGISLRPQSEYVHPTGTRVLDGVAHVPGAMQRLASRSTN